MSLVAEFSSAFKVRKDPELALKIVLEEAAEVNEALEHLLKEICDLHYAMACLFNAAGVVEGSEMLREEAFDKIISPHVGDVIDFVFDSGELEEAFLRVHRSNMSKLGADGRPIRRADGKVLKGPNYQPPTLHDLILKGQPA